MNDEYNPYTNPLTSVEQMEYGRFYPVTHLQNIIIGRGRRLDESLRNDPLAPAPYPHKTRTKCKLFTKGQIEHYINSTPTTSEQDNIIEEAIEKRLRSKESQLETERKKLENERRMYEKGVKDARDYAVNEARSIAQRVLRNKKVVSVKDMSLRVSGVYFLYLGGEIQYVGQSVNIFARLSTHIKEKKFDEVRILYCEPHELDDYEGMFIRLLRPPLNGVSSAPRSKFMVQLDRLSSDFLGFEVYSKQENQP